MSPYFPVSSIAAGSLATIKILHVPGGSVRFGVDGKPGGVEVGRLTGLYKSKNAKDGMTIGVGAGQMSRVYSAKIAGIKAADENLEVAGSVMASDAFFPFRDGIDAAAEAGIKCVIQPGGSMRDDEVIAAADEHGMAMIFTGMRHFRH